MELSTTEKHNISEITRSFDSSYKMILVYNQDIDWYYISDWINKNTKDSVTYKFIKSEYINETWYSSDKGKDTSFFAFKNIDDALLCKIKFGGQIIKNIEV